jgi:Spy/CpxP family protein refolding chaperone
VNKNLLFKLMFVFFICSAILYAQSDGFVDWEVQRLAQKLELTEPQVERLKQIITANIAELEQLREQNQGNPDAIRTAEKDIEDTMRGQIKVTLTPEQLEKFMEIKESVHLPRPMQDNRMKVMKDRLNLTEEQSMQIEQILLEERDKMEALRVKRGPVEEQDRMDSMRELPGPGRDAGHEEMEKIRQEIDKKIEALLTAEQIKEYQKMKKERDEEMRGPGQRPGMGGPPPGMGGRPQH